MAEIMSMRTPKKSWLRFRLSRVLVTAHDAFNYFARRYNFDDGYQGIQPNQKRVLKILNDW